MIGNKGKVEVSAGGLHNTLAIGTHVKGDISMDIDFRLDGQVEGNIRCGSKIVIGPKGHVIGDIESVNAEIAGILDGNIRTTEKLILKSTAAINGDIITNVLEVEPNAKINGSCKMVNEKIKESKPKDK
jgi:cytoskeletal protein CcmA (bactofilin family)